MAETTPLMEQYAAIKSQYKNEVLFFRLGDFYEMFNEDAVEVSRLLNLTLTHRAQQPMCGIPYHAAKIYIARLLRLGKKIAICEQLSLNAPGKGLAERKVIEVITPGNAVEDEYLEQTSNNWLASLCVSPVKKDTVSFSYIDISTGAFFCASFPKADMAEEFSKHLGRVSPSELIIASSLESDSAVRLVLEQFPNMAVSWEQDWHFSQELGYKRLTDQFAMTSLAPFSLTDKSPEIAAAGYLLEYVSKTANTMHPESGLPQVTNLTVVSDEQYVLIDDASRRSLEIVTNLRDGTSQYSLLETLLYTVTAMGSRLLKTRLLYPLRDVAAIKARQDRIELFYNDRRSLTDVRNELSRILDVERLASRIAMERAHAKDLVALKTSLTGLVQVRDCISKLGLVNGIELDTAKAIISDIQNAILDDPSTSLTEGGIIREGWSEELDNLRDLQRNFNKYLDEYLAEEKAKTGISNLRIRYNRNLGYYMEVSKGKLDAVPEHFILRRALVNGDRYTSARLQELEQELVSANENIIETEKRLFLELRTKIGGCVRYLLKAAAEIAELDVTAALAHAAHLHGWTRPDVDDSSALEIEAGRHPVVEFHMEEGTFVPNEADLTDKRFALVTGPNMAGKSTYLRQNALIVLLAQTGSYVPAKKAHIGVVDRIFCRVGASDNLARGESTFLVEMTETARILRSATEKSLVIMDEVGRGTSTEDGLAIAWAVSEHLLNVIKAKTFFATHYHELTRMVHPLLQQLCLEVLENDGNIVFLKHIKQGAVENSYGIHVAKLAGVPSAVIQRAEQVLSGFGDSSEHNVPTETQTPAQKPREAGLFSDEELILDEILSLEPDDMTPLQALQAVARWKKALSGR
ncbi:MAG: DNA mismatch repair protein MutS [Treponema sp.]|nr:DNA mismatch repair protein MutS [Candidatus Treponema caballi]